MKLRSVILLTLPLFCLTSCGKQTIVWRDYNGNVIKTEKISKNSVPQYDGETPTKPSTESSVYVFVGWNQYSNGSELVYRPEFKEEPRTYTVTWKNYDGAVLETQTVEYGSNAIYTGVMPSKESETIDNYYYSYKFSGWSESTNLVRRNIETIAQFTTKKMSFDEKDVVDYLLENGTGEFNLVSTSNASALGYYESKSYFLIYGSYVSSSYSMDSTYLCSFGGGYFKGIYKLQKNGLLIYECRVEITVQNHLYKSAEITEVMTNECTESEKSSVSTWIVDSAKTPIKNASNYLADHNLPYIY